VFGSQRVEVELRVVPQLEVLDALTAGEEIVGDVQVLVGFLVRQMPRRQVEVAIDVPGEFDLLSQGKRALTPSTASPRMRPPCL
jgi:hypothetical protein